MTMTREEYLNFTLKEHEKMLRTEHNNAPFGSVVVFTGFYGRAYYTKQADGTWSRDIQQ